MKRVEKVGLAIALTAGLSWFVVANADSVKSQNVVGMLEKSLFEDELEIVGVPFLGTNVAKMSEVFGDSLPLDSKAYIWTGSGYVIEDYKTVLGPPPGYLEEDKWTPDTATVSGEDGFWIKLPSGTNVAVHLLGEVPDDGTVEMTIEPGLNLVAYPYSADMIWTNTALANGAVLGDKAYFWDQDAQAYSITKYKTVLGPPPGFLEENKWTFPDMELAMGKGVWYESATNESRSVIETRPYNLD
jgi:hypothetical protein